MLIASVETPLFARVRVCAVRVVPTAVLEKVRPAGTKEMPEVKVTPVPVNATVCTPVPVLSLIVKLPALTPAAAGVKVTLIVQFSAAFKVEGQLFV